MNMLKAFLYANLIAIPITILVFLGVEKVVAKYEVEFKEFTFDTKPTTFKDRDNNTLANFYPDRRSVTIYEETPTEIIDAFLASEDRDFFNHAGISIRGIARAATAIFQSGNIVQGGSTITQQFVKMSMLTSEKSYERKLTEVFYALQLEEQHNKKEILELYLNQLEYKYQAFGLKDALMTYYGLTFQEFNQLPKEQKVSIAAMMTAMVQNPTQFDPFQKVELSTKKRNEVIYDMYVTSKISKEVYEGAKNLGLDVLEKPKRVFEDEKITNQELVHYALKEASEQLGMTIEEVKSSGYDIITSYDLNIYKIIREEFEDSENFPKNNGSGGAKVQGSAVFISPLNGEIIAFTGGREEIQNFMDFNRAFQMKKQPASTFKPVIVYGPALESGKFTPNSKLLDEAGHVFPGGYTPKNWDNGGRGTVTMKEAVRKSWNIPAVWTLQQVGIPYAKEYAEKLGIDLSEEPNYLSMALGGLEKGVTPMEMADAYQVFSTGGYRTEAHSIRMITDKKGKVIYRAAINTENIVNTKNASSVKSMLTDAVQNGTGSGAKYGAKVGGKTGTNGHGIRKGANSDYWFVGFDDDVIVGSVWIGFDNLTKDDYLGGSSSHAAKLFKEMAKPISKIVKGYDLQNKFETVTKDDGEYVVKELPELKLIGDSYIELELGQEYIEYGVEIKDENFGDLKDQIHIEGKVNINVPGEYIIKYQLLDGFDVVSEITRRVVVKEAKTNSANYNKELEYSQDGEKVTLHWDKFIDDNVIYEVYRNDGLVAKVRENSFTDNVKVGDIALFQVVITKNGETLAVTSLAEVNSYVEVDIVKPDNNSVETENKDTETTQKTTPSPTLPPSTDEDSTENVTESEEKTNTPPVSNQSSSGASNAPIQPPKNNNSTNEQQTEEISNE